MITFTIKVEEVKPGILSMTRTASTNHPDNVSLPTTLERDQAQKVSDHIDRLFMDVKLRMAQCPDGWAQSFTGPDAEKQKEAWKNGTATEPNHEQN